MSLDAHTLKLLTAKDQFLEAQWLDAWAFCYLMASTLGYDLMRMDASQTGLMAEGLGSTLPYSGQLVCTQPDLAYLGLDGLLHRLDNGESIRLPGPSSDLQFHRGAFYLVSEIDGCDQLVTYREQSWRTIYSQVNYLRHLSLHPRENLAIALSWSRTDLPWLSAELLLLHFGDHDELRVEVLHPPTLNSPCGEAEFSPSGDSLVASFLTGEYFQLWLYRIKTQNWVQLSFDEREHSTPLRRSSRRTFTFLKDGLLAYVSSEKSFWRIDTIDYLGHGHRVATPLTYIQAPRAQQETASIIGFGGDMQHPYSPVRFDSFSGHWSVCLLGEEVSVDKNIRAERLSWSSVNGETIHGILYRDRSRTSLCPLILPVHGGPSDAVQATWPAKALAFVRQGYAVLYVNFRGSFGYGMSYLAKLEGSFAQLEINDLVSGVKSLSGSGWIDSTRVGLWGGGVASLSVLRALSLHPEVFSAGVAVFPILDLKAHLDHCPAAERAELIWALGTTEADILEQRSAQHVLGSLTRPLALFAGALDPLVDPLALEVLAEQLKARKVPCWLTLYEDEGRSWQKNQTYSDYYSKVSGFFDRFLKYRS